MKWIGQHIWDQVSRFRNSVYVNGDYFYVTSDNSRFISTEANDPLVQIRNERADSNGARLRFMKQRLNEEGTAAVDGVDNDVCGTIEFYSYDDGTPSTQNYAQIQGTIHDATSGEESGKLTLGVASHDGGVEDGLVLTGGSVDGEVDATIGNGAASSTTIAGTLGVTGDVTFEADIKIGGGDISGPTDGALTISADTDLIFKIDSDNDGTETFQFKNGAGTEIAKLDESGNLQIDGKLITGSTDAIDSSGLIQVANQTGITGVGTISSGTWQGTSITTTYTAAKVTSIVAGDGIDVSGATGDVTVTAETASDSNPGVVELATTGEADTGTDTARAVTPAGLKSHVDLRYAYAYMTWSASGTSTHDGSGNPEWVFPNAAKGIYEEDWTKDENITTTTTGSTLLTTSRHTAVNALVIPHTGYCVGFHAHGRNDDSDLTFKAGLFHYDGGTTGATNATGIDYGSTGTGHDMTLRWIATADEAESGGGSDGSAGAHSFKGPCKLISNTDALAVTAGDALLPAIMGNSSNTTDEIFVTMTIILKIPLTT